MEVMITHKDAFLADGVGPANNKSAGLLLHRLLCCGNSKLDSIPLGWKGMGWIAVPA